MIYLYLHIYMYIKKQRYERGVLSEGVVFWVVGGGKVKQRNTEKGYKIHVYTYYTRRIEFDFACLSCSFIFFVPTWAQHIQTEFWPFSVAIRVQGKRVNKSFRANHVYNKLYAMCRDMKYVRKALQRELTLILTVCISVYFAAKLNIQLSYK